MSKQRNLTKLLLNQIPTKYTIKPHILINIFHNLQAQKPTSLSFVQKLNASYKNFRQAISTSLEINQYLFSKDKVNHINLHDDTALEKDRGELFKRIEKKHIFDSSSLHKASTDEADKANILAIGGIDFDTPKHLSALLKLTNTLAKKSSIGDKSIFNALAVMPEVDRQTRYEAAQQYVKDPTYYPPYIKDRVEKFILPKMFADDTVFDIPIHITLLTFSIGGREAMMMENALYDILAKQLHLPAKTIQSLMSNVVVVSLGQVPMHSMFKPSGFNHLNIFSTNDRAVLMPNDTLQQIFIKETLFDRVFEVIYNEVEGKNSFKYSIILNNRDTLNQEDYADHTITDYLEYIEALPVSTQEIIGDNLIRNNIKCLGDIDEFSA